MPTGKHDKEFAEQMEGDITATITVSNSALDQAIYWIEKNLDPDEVFTEKQLSSWAENNGFIKEN